jgi:hypothetical protein
MNATIIQLIRVVAALILGSGVIDRILAAVKRWAVAQFHEGTPKTDRSTAKRHGVLQELETWGKDPGDEFPVLGEARKRLGIELAYQIYQREEDVA